MEVTSQHIRSEINSVKTLYPVSYNRMIRVWSFLPRLVVRGDSFKISRLLHVLFQLLLPALMNSINRC